MNKTYDEYISEILNSRGRFACGDEYHERHHIVPKCLGGTNDKENLIDLYAREHFEAHRLLALENLENDSLIYAWACMAWLKDDKQHRVEISPEEYEELRKKYSEMCSKRYAGENNPMYGVSPRERMDEETYKIWKQKLIDFTQSDEFRQQRREKNIGKKYPDEVNKKKGRKGSGHPFYGKHHTEETKQKLRDINTGKRYSDEVNAKKGKAGEENAFYGRKHSDESKAKMSISQKSRFASVDERKALSERITEAMENPEVRKKISDAKKGKPLSNETKRKMSESRKGAKNSTAKKVVQYDLNGNFMRVWDYIKQASEALNINRCSIGACCMCKQTTAGGFIWRYYDGKEFDYEQNISI